MTVKRVIVSRENMGAVKQSLVAANIYFTCGTSSIFCPTLQTKWIIDEGLVNYYGTLLTAGEIAKQELDRAFPHLKRVGWQRREVRLFDKRWPAFCTDEHKGRFVYTDLKAAYWQIYRWLYLDVVWPGGIGEKSLWELADRLEFFKTARNAVIGIIRSREIVGVKGPKSWSMRASNKYLSPGLWAMVMDILHEAAHKAKETGAVYCMVDGWFHPVESDWKRFHKWLRGWNLDFRSDIYEGHILGWGSWHMEGFKTTTPYKVGARGRISHVTQCAPPEHFLSFWDNCRMWEIVHNGKS